ncbi:hypothetical protein [Neisseria sp. Marseille-Q2251]|uniref:hypothetical protein n=1 Tax=Neisseria sp. Marseille-Q2251 TaxID=2866585 RepID=UPI003139BFAC
MSNFWGAVQVSDDLLSWKEQICHQPNLFHRIKRDKQVQRIRQAFGLQKTSWKPKKKQTKWAE